MLCKSYKHGGLKIVNIFEKIVSLQYSSQLSWLESNTTFYNWKLSR